MSQSTREPEAERLTGRRLVELGAVGAAGVAANGLAAAGPASAAGEQPANASLAAAYSALDTMMDAYSIRAAQAQLGRGQTFGGKEAPGGVVAASSQLDTGFGFSYFPNLHAGATAWYALAAQGVNPYRLLPRGAETDD
jgi:hypothetical protein